MKKMTEGQCRNAINSGYFDQDLLESNTKVILALTQSWCPQWHFMSKQLEEIEAENPDITVYYVEYDLQPFYQEFMEFKENQFQNYHVPYLLYFKEGKNSGQSNFTYKEGILEFLR